MGGEWNKLAPLHAWRESFSAMKKLLAGLALAGLALSGCSAPTSFDDYIHAECDPTTAEKVTACRSAPLPIPTETVTATATPTPTATTAPAATVSAATKLNWGTPITSGSDEFNYSGAPDAAKWDSYNTSGHHGAGRRMKAQSVVSDGFLTHTGLPNGDTGYVSSKYRPGAMYGNWEARMRTNLRDSEYHPVMLIWPDTGAQITTEDEVDFAEGTGDTSKMKFYLHYGPAGSTTQTRAEKVIDTTQWHNYAVSWSQTGVRGYIDGELWFEDTEPSHNPDQPMHSAIQLDWFPDGTALTESKMQVDWFRQYAPATATATPTQTTTTPAPPPHHRPLRAFL